MISTLLTSSLVLSVLALQMSCGSRHENREEYQDAPAHDVEVQRAAEDKARIRELEENVRNQADKLAEDEIKARRAVSELSSSAVELDIELSGFDNIVGEYLMQAALILNMPKVDSAALSRLLDKKNSALKKITKLEQAWVAVALDGKEFGTATVAWNKSGLALTESEIRMTTLGNLRALLTSHHEAILAVRNIQAASVNPPTGASTTAPTPSVPTPPARSIALTDDESAVNRSTANGVGFTRDSSGNIQSFTTKQEAVAFANSNNFNSAAVDAAFTMAQKTGGALRFSPRADGISVVDILANIKDRLNKSSEDLELVFAIDYSQSMSEDIAGVIGGLQEITTSLQAVSNSGRTVRVGISLFGKAGRESIALDMTTNMATVAKTLKSLLAAYGDNSHTDHPGESSMHGLALIANKMSFRKTGGVAKPMIILITDEGSKEMIEDPNYANQVWQSLKDVGLDVAIYTIVTQ